MQAEWQFAIPLYPLPAHPTTSQIGVGLAILTDSYQCHQCESVVSSAFPVLAMTRDVDDHGDPYPSPHPSTRIPKHLTQVIPVASQIGVSFSVDRGTQPPSAAGFPITAITCDVGDHGDPYPSPILQLGFQNT